MIKTLFWLTLQFVNVETGQVEYSVTDPGQAFKTVEECKELEQDFRPLGMKDNSGKPVYVNIVCEEKLDEQPNRS